MGWKYKYPLRFSKTKKDPRISLSPPSLNYPVYFVLSYVTVRLNKEIQIQIPACLKIDILEQKETRLGHKYYVDEGRP